MESNFSNTALIFQIQSTLIVVLLFIGVYFRKQRNTHVKIMISAITWDLLLIIQIELNRGAIAKAAKAANNEALLNIHILIAILTVVFYGIMVYTGRKIIKGELLLRPRHKICGIITLVLRLLTYSTSFFIVH